jgi:hypothetical protein
VAVYEDADETFGTGTSIDLDHGEVILQSMQEVIEACQGRAAGGS